MSKRIALLAVAVIAIAGLAVSAATASPKKHVTKQSSNLLVGINDEAFTLYGDPTIAFATLKSLNTQVIRVNLYWGGTKWAVANKSRPADPTDPGDAAYDWTIYDRLVRYATQYNIKVVFSILFTPGWANGGKAQDGRTDELQRSRQLLLCGRRALQRALDAAGLAAGPVEPDDEAAAAEGEPLDGVERAEQPDLAHAAVQARRQDVARRERVQLREDLQCGLQRRALAISSGRCRTSTSRAASRGRRATTRRARSARRSTR